ncbi:hypothetical protein PMSD_25960 [Paenibacillus macquariensis subsp. defensor]|nr:hypothetical protein PMSD_25960 [Paenibacillus macquariensis subsp. defensor]
MNKKQVKEIRITEVIVNHLSSGSDMTGEWTTNCNIDFILSIPFSFFVFDKEHRIDRVKMVSSWDVIELHYANEKEKLWYLPITKSLIHKIWDQVKEQQKDGILKGWAFDDEIFEMLTGEKETSSAY